MRLRGIMVWQTNVSAGGRLPLAKLEHYSCRDRLPGATSGPLHCVFLLLQCNHARLLDLNKRVALVTGASGGLGLVMAETLAKVGATVNSMAETQTR
jgi:hypothetical protein